MIRLGVGIVFVNHIKFLTNTLMICKTYTQRRTFGNFTAKYSPATTTGKNVENADQCLSCRLQAFRRLQGMQILPEIGMRF